MATSGFQINGADLTTTWPDRAYLMDRYPELSDTLKQAGLWLWGRNFYGMLGDNTTVEKSSPVQTVSGGANWRMVACGGYHGSGIKTDGTLWTWGFNGSGVLGTNDTTARSSPVQTVSAGTNWKQISSLTQLMAAIKTDGTLWLWGLGGNGQLGIGSVGQRSSPVQTVAAGTNWKQVSVGATWVTAIKTDGSLWTWGFNGDGQLGDNTQTERNSPVQTISAGTNWKVVSAGADAHTSAIKTDGTLWLWGRNEYGQLGINNTSTSRVSSPVQTITGGTNWKHVSTGRGYTAAIKTDGTLWTWGRNDVGQLGDNTRTSRSSPVQTIAAGNNWRLLASGAYNTTAAIKTDGTLWVWGANGFGQLGDTTTNSKSSPVQTVAGGTNWKQVAAYSGMIIAIRDDSSDPL
jgi:alpha-tubulin suppressor-like RCC1 family protein